MSYRIPADERRFKAVDFSEMRMRQGSRKHESGWIGAWLWCLKHNDLEAAELIHSRNQIDEAERTGWAQ